MIIVFVVAVLHLVTKEKIVAMFFVLVVSIATICLF